MRRLLLASLLVGSCAVLADVGIRTGNSGARPQVRDLECQADGGLICFRDAGTNIGAMRCDSASTVNTGCITPSDQTMAGKKTWTGRQRIVGVAHGSLTACSADEKGTLQTCTTHNSPVWCDGTDNHELLGSSSDEVALICVNPHGTPGTFWGGVTLPSGSAWTVNAISGFANAGTGSGAMRLTIAGTAGNCLCDVDCDAPGGRTSCSGTCTFSAADDLFFFRLAATSPCTLDPSYGGTVCLMGVAQ